MYLKKELLKVVEEKAKSFVQGKEICAKEIFDLMAIIDPKF